MSAFNEERIEQAVRDKGLEAPRVTPADIDELIGREIARAEARDKIGELEGYLLRDRLFSVEENKPA